MSAPQMLRNLLRFLGGRFARNAYLWLILLYIACDLNRNNERAYHWGITSSSWYWPVMGGGFLLQLILVYGNNLALIPHLLARKKKLAYLASAFALVVFTSLVYTFGLKIANAHLRVDNLQQIGMVTGPVAVSWSFVDMLDGAQTYIFGNACWVFIFTMAWYMNDYARQRRVAEQAQQRQAQTELAFLKSQLNPHFLFNTLNNLYALALKNAEETPDCILKLSAILRYLLYESNIPLASFEKEKEIMLAYIDLELLRLKDHGRLHFSISADRNYAIPPLLWLPVLENIFKHGTRIISPDIFADYRFRIEQDVLSIEASNFCKQCDTSGNASGIGLVNLEKRLALLYPGKHTLSKAFEGNTFTISLKVQLA